MNKKEGTINEAMISENNSKKLLRIFESDIARFVICAAGMGISSLFSGVWAGIGMIATGFGALYYFGKGFLRVNRVQKEDASLAKLEQQSPDVAQKEIERQHVALTKKLKSASKEQQLPSPRKVGILKRLMQKQRRHSETQKERDAA